MAARNSFLDPDLKSLSQLVNCSVESGEPDPRGWTVFMSDGRQIGTVIDLLIDDDRKKYAVKVRYLVVDVNAGALPGISDLGSTAVVRIEDVELDGGSQRVTAHAIACDDIHGLHTDRASRIHPSDSRAPVTTV